MTRRRTNPNRRGVAATELAVCLPVIVLLVLGTIECCTMIFLKQSLTVAAYEGVRMGIRPNASAADVQTTCDGILKDRRVQGGAVEVTPNNISSAEIGEFIDVTVSAPASRNSIIPGSFFRGKTLSATASMMKEF
jgi:hypothetical protein